MAKTIWIRAKIKGCNILTGKLEMDVLCGNYNAIGETIHPRPIELSELPNLICYIKGMVNSSQNALVRAGESWGPLGRLSNRFELKHGVAVYQIVNEFSRDGNIDCVSAREDAEKLCLLEQKFPGCQWSLLRISEFNGLHIDRLTAQGLKTLDMAVTNKLRKYAISDKELQMDDRVKAMVIAGV